MTLPTKQRHKSFNAWVRWLHEHAENVADIKQAFSEAAPMLLSRASLGAAPTENTPEITLTRFPDAVLAQVRASHAAPLGFQSNFMGTPDRPVTFWGVEGAMEGHASDVVSCGWRAADIFKGTGVHTGSGSGGHRFQYDVRLYALDWKFLTRAVVLRELNNKDTAQSDVWGDRPAEDVALYLARWYPTLVLDELRETVQSLGLTTEETGSLLDAAGKHQPKKAPSASQLSVVQEHWLRCQ